MKANWQSPRFDVWINEITSVAQVFVFICPWLPRISFPLNGALLYVIAVLIMRHPPHPKKKKIEKHTESDDGGRKRQRKIDVKTG